MYYESYGEIFELGRGIDFSINDIAKLFNTEIKYLPDVPGNYRNTLSDSSRAYDLLKWKATINLEDYIRKFIDEKN